MSSTLPPVAVDENQVAELLVHVSRVQRRRFRELLAPWNLSPHQARALRGVSEGAATRVTDLADRLRIAPRSATEVADGLESRGLITRTPDPHDRRAVLLEATPAGRRLLTEIDTARAADARAFLGRLSAEDRAELARLLRRLSDDE